MQYCVTLQCIRCALSAYITIQSGSVRHLSMQSSVVAVQQLTLAHWCTHMWYHCLDTVMAAATAHSRVHTSDTTV
eukprot:10181-Heterococcus_DN1.PRE.2